MSNSFRQVEMQLVYGFFHYLATVIYSMFFRGEVYGSENLPQEGSFLIAPNPTSFLDPPFIGSPVPRPIEYFTRKTLWNGSLS